jgi:hypothetical protein
MARILQFIVAMSLTLALLPSQGCTAGPRVSTLQASSECHVWTTSGVGTLTAKVTEHAEIYSTVGSLRAVWVDQTRFAVPGRAQNITGTYEPPYVKIQGLAGNVVATLSPPSAQLHGPLGNLTLTSNAACQERQLALGTAVITVAILLLD